MILYAAAPPDERTSVVLEGMTILYDRRSGTTHILASPAPELMAALSAGRADAGELVARLGGAEALDAEDDPVAVIEARLAELETAGLVARA